MADITYTQFPIEADIVDISQIETDISNAQTDILNLGQNKADKTTTINGLSLAQNRTLYVQDIPSKNLLPTISSSTTINGVTYTLNSDGSISTGGTAGTGGSQLFLVGANWVGVSPYPLDKTKSYIMSGCPSGGSNSTYRISIFEYYNGGSSNVNYSDIGDGVEFTPYSSATSWLVVINIQPGAGDMTGKTFYPMIRPSSAPSGYVPYAKTNVELSQGSAGSNHTKLPDGTLIQWGYIIDPTPVSATGSAWVNSLYFHEYMDPVTFPIPFISQPALMVSKAGGRTGMVSWSSVTATKITEIDIVSSQQTPSSGVYLFWIAIGRWK